MIQIYHGTGKGKTTAALGLLLRARGAGLSCAIVFFDKGGSNYSERNVLEQIGVKVLATGVDRVDKKTWKFRFGVTQRDKSEALRALAHAVKLIRSREYAVIVLDEILNCVRLKMLSLTAITKALKKIPSETEVILTGRGLPASLEKLADLITEMREEKHYFSRGVMARAGIEF